MQTQIACARIQRSMLTQSVTCMIFPKFNLQQASKYRHTKLSTVQLVKVYIFISQSSAAGVL